MMDFKIFLLLLLQALIQESYAKSTSSNHRQKQGFGQVLVATGVIKENGVLVHTNKVESVDLDSDSSVCSTVDNFPSPRDGAFVAMMKGGGDMICGGFKMETLGDCYWIKPTLQWQHQTDFDLKNRRRFATAVTSYFMGTSVFGGESETNQLDSLEITRGYGWETLSTSPETMSRNCMTTFPGDQFKFFAIGGLVGNERFSDKTYIFDTRTSKWSNGTSLNVGREFHSCSLISPGFVIVVGGSNQASVLDSVEIFDVTTQQWSFGPQLDTKIYLASLTSTPNGGVALIGGNDGSEVLSSIYLLADVNPGSEWVKLSRSLAHPRRSHVTMSFNLCRNESADVDGDEDDK